MTFQGRLTSPRPSRSPTLSSPKRWRRCSAGRRCSRCRRLCSAPRWENSRASCSPAPAWYPPSWFTQVSASVTRTSGPHSPRSWPLAARAEGLGGVVTGRLLDVMPSVLTGVSIFSLGELDQPLKRRALPVGAEQGYLPQRRHRPRAALVLDHLTDGDPEQTPCDDDGDHRDRHLYE